MDIWQAIVAGIVQGLTEFLPVSSNAHVKIVPELLHWGDPGAAFTAVIQLGTLLAVVHYFQADIVRIGRAWFSETIRGKFGLSFDGRMGWMMILATLPIVVLGLLLKHYIEHELRSNTVIAAALIGLAAVLAIAELRYRPGKAKARGDAPPGPMLIVGRAAEGFAPQAEPLPPAVPMTIPPADPNLPILAVGVPYGKSAPRRVAAIPAGTNPYPSPTAAPAQADASSPAAPAAEGPRRLTQVTWFDALVIGLWQCVALVPGASRSGVTITGGLFQGLSRDTAARFSFLLSLPAVFAAGIYELYKERHELLSSKDNVVNLAVATVISFVVGYVSIVFLLNYLKHRSTWVFILYRIGAGIGLLAAIHSGWIRA